MKCALMLIVVAACGSSAALPDAAPLGGDRPVGLQAPPSIESGKTYPLILILHGYGANGFVQQRVFHMADEPKTRGAFVMAPDGLVDSTGHSYWNADAACCDLDHTGNDDVAYLGGLLDRVIAEHPIDRSRVFVIGHSNGAWMAYRLACDRADVVTDIVALAGAASSMPSSCNPVKPVSVLHMHGTADQEVPYAGADAGGLHVPGAVESVAVWAAHDQCSGALTPGAKVDIESNLAGDETQENATAGCPPNLAADLWTIEGGVHLPNFGDAIEPDLWAWLDAHPRAQ
ncbi:MAG TPA: PHB depolymerase family esterase [Kofleriaceae bacterium]|nr:PHB depolymerase family esterase [Kofleriaceae bacterium]